MENDLSLELLGLGLAQDKNKKIALGATNADQRIWEIWQRFPHLNLRKHDNHMIIATFPFCPRNAPPMQP